MKTVRHARRVMRALALCGAMTAASMLTGCISMNAYVDPGMKEIAAADMKKPAQPKPAQVVFEFQNQGAPNAAGTKLLKDVVLAEVAESGLLTASEGGPAAGLLTISINNIPVTKDAAASGFVTGMTLGLAGSAVTDGYVCTVSYLAAGQAAPIVKTARTSIHTTIGNASGPANVTKSENMESAVKTMTRNIVSNAMRDLSLDPAFN